MFNWFCIAVLIASFGAVLGRQSHNNLSFDTRLKNAHELANIAMSKIYKEWEIDSYPNFLQTLLTSPIGWEKLKHKYERRIIESEISNTVHNFTISFLGSSVTAGHDSLFSQAYPAIVDDIMSPVFAALDINLIVRNVALGNNPCMPYDVCVETFAGADADIVQWEQTYNCGFDDRKEILEQFIRQSLLLPSKPVIAFTQSWMPPWYALALYRSHDVLRTETDCPSPLIPHTLSSAEKRLLETLAPSASMQSHSIVSGHSLGAMKIATEINNDYHQWFFMDDVIKHYPHAGIHLFSHNHHESYKCLGPYIKNWQEGALSWHPSVIGHKLRAAHHAYYWLAILKHAIEECLKHITTPLQHPPALTEAALPRHLNPTNVSDRAQCYTNYEPHVERAYSLHNIVIEGMKGWTSMIYEGLFNDDLIKKSRERGYQDFKHVMHGNKESGPLSLHISPRQEGVLFVCEAPGIWGGMPTGFEHLYDGHVDYYISKYRENFVFNMQEGTKLTVSHRKLDELCVQFTEHVPAGDNVLTVLPTTEARVVIAVIVTP